MYSVGAFRSLLCALLCTSLCIRAFAQATPSTHQRSLRIIVVADESAARQILERLVRGEDFAALAKEKSIDPTAQAGGNMGLVDPNSLRSELRETLQGLTPGQVSKIVHIPEGYAILETIPTSQAAENTAFS